MSGVTLPDLPDLSADLTTPRTADGDSQRDAPFAESLRRLATIDFLPFHVPGHQSRHDRNPLIAGLFGDGVARMDLPMSMASVDQRDWSLHGDVAATPKDRAQRLAAEAWGASRVWWVTNGASGGNHVACLAARLLGPELVVQRSVHSSVIDGLMMSGGSAHFVAPTVDEELGAAQSVTVQDAAATLQAHPDSAALYVVSPSYFGAVADVAGLAELAHAHGIPLIVDEAWGSHFGFHPGLPSNAVRQGADLVISSTHKNAGSLTQSAMLQLGHSEHARRLEPLVERTQRAFQSTSSSALLMLSLDEARRRLMIDGPAAITHTLEAAAAIRAGIAAGGRFREESDRVLASAGTVAHDPLKIVINTAAGGISGREAQHLLLRDHRIGAEMSTHSCIVLLIGATAEPDVERFLRALHSLPDNGAASMAAPLPPLAIPERRTGIREAFMHPFEIVPAADAVGRVSADALAAYPPGIPNLLPGEVISAGAVRFLQATAATASGYVRGAADPQVSTMRVLRDLD